MILLRIARKHLSRTFVPGRPITIRNEDQMRRSDPSLKITTSIYLPNYVYFVASEEWFLAMSGNGWWNQCIGDVGYPTVTNVEIVEDDSVSTLMNL